MRKSIISLLCLCLYSYQSIGQTCCSAGAPLSNMITVDNTNQLLSFTLGYEYKGINLLIDNNQRLINDPRRRQGQNASLKTDYLLHERWALSATIPFLFQSRTTVSESESSLGLGDISLVTQYQVFQKEKLAIHLAAGLELPTGVVNHTGPSSIFLSPDMQSGSGTLDVLIGGSLFYDNFINSALAVSTEVLYKRNGTNENFASTDNFSGRRFGFGHETLASIGLRYQYVHSLGFFFPDLALKYRNSGPNREQTTDAAPNSGGNWLSLPVGFSFVPSLDKSIRVFAELPLIQNLSGLQITTSFTFGVQVRYSLQKKDNHQTIINL